MTINQLLLGINKNFEIDKKGKVEKLFQDSCEDLFEAKQAKALFKKKYWNELTFTDLTKHQAILNYFSDQAYVYFLPAYLKFVAVDFEKSDVLIDTLLAQLKYPTKEEIEHEYKQYQSDPYKIIDLEEFYQNEINNISKKQKDFITRHVLLNREQSKTVLNFLKYLETYYMAFLENDVINNIIQLYWKKYI